MGATNAPLSQQGSPGCSHSSRQDSVYNNVTAPRCGCARARTRALSSHTRCATCVPSRVAVSNRLHGYLLLPCFSRYISALGSPWNLKPQFEFIHFTSTNPSTFISSILVATIFCNTRDHQFRTRFSRRCSYPYSQSRSAGVPRAQYQMS